MPLEVKRCEVLPTPPKKRTARIQVGGKAPCGRIADRNAAAIIPSIRRSTRLLGGKRKSYEEKTPEQQDYGGDSDWEDDRNPGSWGCGDEDDGDWPMWEEGAWKDDKTEDRHQDKGKDKVLDFKDDPEPLDGHIPGCCPLCRRLIRGLFYEFGDARRSIESIKIRMKSLEDSTNLDYKFHNQNIRKLFGTVGNLKKGIVDDVQLSSPCDLL
jgi:hypothetical protein